ncbi:MAG: serine protease, partial [Pseudomonadota bacterium]
MIVLLSSSVSVFANNKVIYGNDNRVNVLESNSFLTHLADSTAGMIATKKVVADPTHAGYFTIKGGTLASRGICADERFANEITAASCSGFLVGEDLLVTAGHCMQYSSQCRDNVWVFGFYADQNGKVAPIPQENIYRCKEIISQELNEESQLDFALIRLEKKVTNREPLKFRQNGKVSDTTNLVVIGHPTGLPTKIADGANIRDNSNEIFFVANLDTFGGNSGSAVLDAETGQVEGILVRGEEDYIT